MVKTIKELLIKLDVVALFSFFYVLRICKRTNLPTIVRQTLCQNSIGICKTLVSRWLDKFKAKKTLKKSCKNAKMLCLCKNEHANTIYMYRNKPELKISTSETAIVLFKYLNTIKPLTYKCFYDLIYKQAWYVVKCSI